MSISKYGSIKMTGSHPSKLPDGAGDAYYEQDRIRDFAWLWQKAGEIGMDISNGKFILSGGRVSIGSGGNTFDVSAGSGYVRFAIAVGTDGSTPPATADETIRGVRVEWPAQNDIGSVSGTTTYYVKVRYAESDSLSRTRLKAGGTWYFAKAPSYTFTIDTTADTADDLLLATATVVSGQITAIDPVPLSNLTGLDRYPLESGYSPAIGDTAWLSPSGAISKGLLLGPATAIGTPYACAVCAIRETEVLVVSTSNATVYLSAYTFDRATLAFTHVHTNPIVTSGGILPAQLSVVKVGDRKALVAYQETPAPLSGASVYTTKLRIVTFDGSTVSYSGSTTLGATAAGTALAYLAADTVAMVYQTALTTLYGAVVTTSGATPSIGTPVSQTITSSAYVMRLGLACIPSADRGIVVTRTASDHRLHTWSRSSSTWTWGTSDASIAIGGNFTPTVVVIGDGEVGLITSPQSFSASVGIGIIKLSGSTWRQPETMAPFLHLFNQSTMWNEPIVAPLDVNDGRFVTLRASRTSVSGGNVIVYLNFAKKRGGAYGCYVFEIGHAIYYDSGESSWPTNFDCYVGSMDLMFEGCVACVYGANDNATFDCKLFAVRDPERIVGLVANTDGDVASHGVVPVTAATAGARYFAQQDGVCSTTPSDVEIGRGIPGNRLSLGIRTGL